MAARLLIMKTASCGEIKAGAAPICSNRNCAQAEEIFEKNGKRIPYRTVRLLAAHTQSPGENGGLEFLMKDAGPRLAAKGTKKRNPKDRKSRKPAEKQKKELPSATPGLEKLEA